MFKYKINVKRVSGRLNESVLPSKSLVVKSKTKKSKSAVLAEASKFFKKKYGLVIESADVLSDNNEPKYVAKFVWADTCEFTYDEGEIGSQEWYELPVKKIYFSTKEELLQQIEDKFYAPRGAAKKMHFDDTMVIDYEDDGHYYVSWCTIDAEGEKLMTRDRKHFYEQRVAFNVYPNVKQKQVRI